MLRKKSTASITVTNASKFVVNTTWAIDPLLKQNEILICAQHALIGAKEPELQMLQRAIPPVAAAAHEPVSTAAESSVAWATWHHGSDFYTYWCGDVATILQYSSLTDTERELVLLRARKAESQGMKVYATGAKLTHEPPKKLESDIEHIGLVYLRSALHV